MPLIVFELTINLLISEPLEHDLDLLMQLKLTLYLVSELCYRSVSCRIAQFICLLIVLFSCVVTYLISVAASTIHFILLFTLYATVIH